MKISQFAKIAAPFLAKDQKPEALFAAMLAADKKARDAMDPSEREAACDAREEAMDEAEEKADKEKAEDAAAKDRKGARDARKAARDARAMDRKAAKDESDDPEHTNDADLSAADPSTAAHGGASKKPAVDAAAVDVQIKAAIAQRDALHAARAEVAPILGVVTMDSAADIYKAALDKLGVDTAGVDPSAFAALLKLAKDRATAVQSTPVMDSDSRAALTKLIPHYGRLS